jgi:uncharacterized membrane protein
MFALKLLAILGTGLVAGVFLAFSSFIMKALGQLKPSEGITAMQFINITVINPLFMTALFGTAIVCLVLAVFSLLKFHHPDSTYLLVGSLLYIFGTVGVTIAFNVPLNDALAKVAPNSSEGAELWANYLTNWTMWNHVRTIAALMSTISFAIAEIPAFALF